MSPAPASFDAYVASLSQLDKPFDPTVPTAPSEEIRAIAEHLASLPKIDREVLAAYIEDQPEAVPVLGLAVGLTRERLKNVMKHHLGSSGWLTLARLRAGDLIAMLDAEYDVVRLVDQQRSRAYDFGDVLAARAGGRRTAAAGHETGRRVEDEDRGGVVTGAVIRAAHPLRGPGWRVGAMRPGGSCRGTGGQDRRGRKGL